MFGGHSLLDIAVAAAGCVMLILTSGLVVGCVLSWVARKQMSQMVDKPKRDTGLIVGKCESILIFIFVLLGAYTALGFVFAAKAIVRLEDAKRDPLYYLAGTMVNVTYSLLVGLLFKTLLILIP
jgi:uncharacterized membrane protein